MRLGGGVCSCILSYRHFLCLSRPNKLDSSIGMMCKDLDPGPKVPLSFGTLSSPSARLAEDQRRLGCGGRSDFGATILPLWKGSAEISGVCIHPGFLYSHSHGGQFRRMSTESKATKRKKKKKSKRGLIKKLKRLRYVTKIKKNNMDHEQKLMARIERVKKRMNELEVLLKKYELPPLPLPEHDPESLTAEELHYLKRLGYKHRNYLIIGVRRIFGGVVQNMHLHWKKHQLVKVRCKNFTPEQIQETGEHLARLSGGIVIDVQQGHTIVMYRGKNYSRPADLIPKNTLNKRKALFKARYEQSLASYTRNLEALEKELKLYQEYKAQETARLFSQEGDHKEPDVHEEPDVRMEGHVSSWSDSEEVDIDPALVCDSDSVLETDSDSDSDSNSVKLKMLQEHRAQEITGLLPQEEIYKKPVDRMQNCTSLSSDSEDIEANPALLFDSDLDTQSGSGSDMDSKRERELHQEHSTSRTTGFSSREDLRGEAEGSIESSTDLSSDSESVDIDPALVCDSDSVLETDSGSDSDIDPDLDVASHSADNKPSKYA